MTNLSSIIRELEQQRDAIDRALAALREVGGSGPITSKATAKFRQRSTEAADERSWPQAHRRSYPATLGSEACHAGDRQATDCEEGGFQEGHFEVEEGSNGEEMAREAAEAKA